MRTNPRTTPILPTALLVFIALCGMAVASRARAGEVHFDPESPAGKEYALPLQQARNEALGSGRGEAGSGEGGGSAGAAAPLFGVGVGVGGTGEAGAQGGRGEGSQSGGQEPESGDGGGRTAAERAVAEAGAATNADYPEGRGLLLLAGFLILGAGIGLGLRAFSRQRPAT